MSDRMELIKKGIVGTTGKTTLAVTIPADQVEILGLVKGSPYEMYKQGDDLIIRFPKAETPDPIPGAEGKKSPVFE